MIATLRRGARCGAGALCLAVPVRAQATLRLTQVPPNTPAGASIYVAGSFNRWDPGAAGYTLTRQASGEYAITLPESVRGQIEFKFTLGSWEKVEQDSAGRDVPNRSLAVPDSGSISYTGAVQGWRDGSPRPRPQPSATASVSVITSRTSREVSG